MPRLRTRRLSCERLESRENPAAVVPPYTFDPAFGAGGKVLAEAGGEAVFGSVADSEVGPDGKIWVLGGGISRSALVRLNADGMLDPTFDGDGIVSLTPDSGTDIQFTFSRIALQPDGRVVVVGQTGGQPPVYGDVIDPPIASTGFVVLRLNADGSLDGSFGTGGRVQVDVDGDGTGYFTAQAAGVLADGQIAFAGTINPSGYSYFNQKAVPPAYAAVRLTADGRPDTAYGPGGVRIIANAAPNTSAGAHATDVFQAAFVAADGSVTVVGSVTLANLSGVLATVRRLTPAGLPDATLDGDGYAEVLVSPATPFFDPPDSLPRPTVAASGLWAVVESAAGDGFYLAASTYRSQVADRPEARSASQVGVTIVRFTAAGAVDAAFGDDGYARQPLSASDSLTNPGPTPYRSLAGFQQFPDATLAVLVLSRTYDPLVEPWAPVYSTDRTTLYRYDAAGRPLAGTLAESAVPFPAAASRGDNLQPAFVFLDAQDRLTGVGATDRSPQTGSRVGAERLTPAPNGRQTLLQSRGNGEVRRVQFGDGPAVVGDPVRPFAGYTGRVQGVVADLDGDGLFDQLFAQAGPSASAVRVVFANADGTTRAVDATPFEAAFTGGVSVAAADLDGDGAAELVVSAGNGGGGRVQVYAAGRTGLTKRADFFGIDDPAFRGGATASAADLDGDGRADLIVAAGQGGGPRVAVFDGRTLLSAAVGLAPPKLMNDFFAFGGDDAGQLRNGVTVAAADVNADGRQDLIFGAGVGGARRVYGVDGPQLLAGRFVPRVNFFVGGDAASRDGVPVAARDVNADGRPDLVAEQTLGVRVYDGRTLGDGLAGEPPVLQDVTVFTDPFDPIPVD